MKTPGRGGNRAPGKGEPCMAHITLPAHEDHPEIDAAALISAMRSSPSRLENLLWRYRCAGFSDREIVAAMAASPRLINPIGKGR